MEKKTKIGTETARQMLKTVAESCVAVNAMVVFIGADNRPNRVFILLINPIAQGGQCP